MNRTQIINSSLKIEQAIEALLFWRGEPVSLKELLKSLSAPEKKISESEIHESLISLSESLKGRGLVLLANEDQEYMLGTSTEASELIERLTKEELSKDLGKASLETLSLIVYRGPIKRSEIDYVRGVNSTFILRNLLVRGLIDKKPAPDDNRTSIYTPSFKLLSYLGITAISELPNYKAVQDEIEKFRNEKEAEPESTEKPESTEGQDTEGAVQKSDTGTEHPEDILRDIENEPEHEVEEYN